jgi:hypothetical protein
LAKDRSEERALGDADFITALSACGRDEKLPLPELGEDPGGLDHAHRIEGGPYILVPDDNVVEGEEEDGALMIGDAILLVMAR